MMGYDYELHFRQGKTNTVADALSRQTHASLSNISVLNTDLLTRIKQSWLQDPSMVHLIHRTKGTVSADSKYTWQADQLSRKEKLVVGNDAALKQEIITYFHSSATGGHSGRDATIQRVSSVFYWKGLKQQIRQFVRECSTCQQYKYDSSAYPGLLQPLPIPNRIWTDISMDFIEKLPRSHGKDTILVVVDRLSKYSHFIALSYPFSALTVAQLFLDHIYRLHGVPQSIVSDRDKIFISRFWQELFSLLGTELKMSSSYHPQTDGQTEVVNRCLETYLRCMTGERPREWARWLPLAEYWYNTTFHSATQTTPYEVVYGQPAPVHLPYLPGESTVEAIDRSLQKREAAIKLLQFHLTRARNRMVQQANKKRSVRSFEVGDLVYVKLQPYRQKSVVNRLCLKLSARFFGPFLVLEKIGPVAYKLALPADARIHPVFHVSQLKKHVGNALVQSQLPLLDDDGTISKEPIAILDRRLGKRHGRAITEVLVQWSNCFPEDATWECLYDLQQRFPTFHP